MSIENQEHMMARYLLGELPEPERARIEERVLADSEYYETLLMVEEELIDRYVRGALTASDRERFEKVFLTSVDKRESVEFARLLARGRMSEPPQVIASTLPYVRRWTSYAAVAAATLILTTGVSWLLFERRIAAERARAEQAGHALNQERSRNSALQHRLDQRGGDANAIVSFALTPGQLRGGVATPWRISASTVLVCLQLQLETHEKYEGLRGILRTAEGDEILTQVLAPPRSGSPEFCLPGSVLESRDYVVRLEGLISRKAAETLASYPFTVVKR